MSKSTSRYTLMRVSDRIVAELVGIARALVADGQITETETTFLAEWLHNAEKDAEGWPFDVVNAQMQKTVARGMDAAARHELYCMLRDLVGEIRFVEIKRLPKEKTTGEVKDVRVSSSLPYTEPVPDIIFFGKVFCFTGKFFGMSRQDCCHTSLKLGASFVDAVKKTLDYLVIGAESSRDWIQSSHGRKIEKVMEINGKGGNIAIISEHDWHRAVRHEQEKQKQALIASVCPDLIDKKKGLF